MKLIPLFLIAFGLTSSSLFGEKEKSYLRTKDDISMKVRKYFKSISIGDIDYAAAFFGEGLEVHVNDLSLTGKAEYLKRLENTTTQLFKDIQFKDLHVHTNYFSSEALTGNGKTFGEYRPNEQTIWTNSWAVFMGVGRTTGKKVSFRIHMDFRTSKGKVVEMLAYYDPTQRNAEREAMEAAKVK